MKSLIPYNLTMCLIVVAELTLSWYLMDVVSQIPYCSSVPEPNHPDNSIVTCFVARP